jgi:hypothetical protein
MRRVLTGRKEDSAYQCYTPENLFDCGWQRLSWVLGLSSAKPNKFGSSKGESRSNEYTAKSLEPVVESARIVPMPIH